MDKQRLAGRYELIEPLGAGGMGQTFIAVDTQRPGQPRCVVKQLQPPSLEAEVLKVVKRLFNKEAETLERLGHHPQVPQLLAYFEQDQEFYLVQEFIAGHPLSQELQPGRVWPEQTVIAFLEELLQVLKFVHEHRVIHRDIKPDNIIRQDTDGKLVLIDFGAVKQVRSQPNATSQLVSRTVAIGTPGYIPPEQQWGQPRLNSDLYAVGKIAIQALTGLLPTELDEDENGEVLWQPQQPVNPQLEAIVQRMVHQYSKNRYGTATEVLIALQDLRTRQPRELEASLSRSTTDLPMDRISRMAQVQAVPPTLKAQRQTPPPRTARTLRPPSTRRPQGPNYWFPLLLGSSLLFGGGIVAVSAWQANQEALPPVAQAWRSTDTASGRTARQPATNGPVGAPDGTAKTEQAELTLARKMAEEQGNLGHAIAMAREIDMRRPNFQEAQQMISQWQADWDVQNGMYKTAETLMHAQRWQEAKATINGLPSNPYWQPKKNAIRRHCDQALATPRTPEISDRTTPEPSSATAPSNARPQGKRRPGLRPHPKAFHSQRRKHRPKGPRPRPAHSQPDN